MSATVMTSGTVPGAAKNIATSKQLGRRRHRLNTIVKSLCVVSTGLGVVFLASILFTLIVRGIGGLSLVVFTTSTLPPGSHGGLLNAIVGSLIQTAIGTLLGTPIGGFSGIAGCVALAVIVIPIVVRTTEDMLRLIPVALREAAVALGAPKWKTIVMVCYPAAKQGIVTGILLAVARIAGETAPLLFTSLGNLNWSVSLAKPMASLPVTIYQYAGSAFEDWVQLAWVGALLITFGVLAINIVARFVLRGGK